MNFYTEHATVFMFLECLAVIAPAIIWRIKCPVYDYQNAGLKDLFNTETRG